MLDSTEYLTSQKLEQQTRNLTAEAQSSQSFSFGNPGCFAVEILVLACPG
jgi:hypothetical protein